MKDKGRVKNLSSQSISGRSVKDGVRHTILGIVFGVVSIFFVLASPIITGGSAAGFVGKYAYQFFHYLLGTGYYLLPAICLLVAISFFRTGAPRIFTMRLVGGLAFIISGLGLIERGWGGTNPRVGGLVGEAVATICDKLFGQASWAIFGALFAISFILIFETTFSLANISEWLKSKKATKDQSSETEEDISDSELEEAENNDGEELVPTEANGKGASIKTKVAGFLNRALQVDAEEFVPLIPADQRPYIAPPLDLLGRDSGKPAAGDIKANSNIIKRTLSNFGIEVEMDEISIGPSITRYALKPAEGVKLSRIVALQNDLALALAAHPLRVEAPIPGKSLVGIEVPNSTKTTVRLGTLLDDSTFRASDKPLSVALGKNIAGSTIFSDIAKMPHILIAGTTGSGKSVTIHALIIALLYRNAPDNLRFIMIDPKRVELTLYNDIPHLLTPVLTNPKKAIMALKWAAKEMDRRYDILEAEAARDIKSYHENVYHPALEDYNKQIDKIGDEQKLAARKASLPEAMPYIVIVIDELADIMTTYPRELEAAIVRIAQMSRAVGIHLILSTQRPSTEVITGLIKANVPTRVALQVPSQIDSRTIIDMPGAEKLLGAGDMLYLSGETSKPVRLQSAFVSEAEVKKVVSFITKNNEGETATIEIGGDAKGTTQVGGQGTASDWDDDASPDDDEMYEEAKVVVQEMGKASSSLLQRKLKLGYARAARLLDLLEERGVVGPGSGAKPREVFGSSQSSGTGVNGNTATDEYGAEFDKKIENEEN